MTRSDINEKVEHNKGDSTDTSDVKSGKSSTVSPESVSPDPDRNQSTTRLGTTRVVRTLRSIISEATPSTQVGFLIVFVLVAIAVLGPEFTPHSPIDQELANRLAPPSRIHPLGTDDLGRDILTRIVYAARLSLGLAALVTVIRLVIGVSVGLAAGYFDGWIDAVLMRAVDVQLAFPGIVLALVIAGMLGPSLVNITIALAVVGWASYARVVRGSVLSLKNQPFVEAEMLAGVSKPMIAIRALLPNVVAPVAVLATLNIGRVIIGIAGLSFIGLGAQPPTAEWGRMVSNGRAYIQTAWWFVTVPGVAIMLTVIGFNLLGEGLRDALDVDDQQTGASDGL